MRILALVILLSATALAFTIINSCNAPQDYVDALSTYLRQAYDMYTQDIRAPALCPNFYVELRNDIQYPAVTYSRVGPFGACAFKMEFRCDISRTWLQHLAFHEMAHALQNAVGDSGKGYGWWSEAHAEGLASYYMAERVYRVGRWQRYGYVQDFWDRRLYRQDPWRCEAPSLCAYQYGAFFAWLAWRHSPLNSTLNYALPMDRLRMAYVNFLLSPWSWGRDPVYVGFDECIGAQMSPNSGVYCTYPVLPNRVYVFSSAHFINATGLPDRILLALVATRTATADVSVTVSYCPDATTVTQTVTQTVTTTQTVTKTETYTVTYTTTATTTVTVPITYTTTVAVPTTVTTTVTVPVTYTTTVTIPTTVTHTDTVTKTETVAVPVTSTVTETATVTVSTFTTVTETAVVGGVPTTVLIIAVVVALLVGCYFCGRATAKTDLKTQEL